MDVGDLIEPAITAVQTGLTAVAGPALLVGAGILALTVGWKFAKRFVKG
jgi:hypothetical protein